MTLLCSVSYCNWSIIGQIDQVLHRRASTRHTILQVVQRAQTEQAALRVGQQLIEDQQRSRARAAAKKAKKQRQKGKRDSGSTSAAVQQQQLPTAQTEEESEQARHMDSQLPKHTQHAQQAQQAQHAVLQGHDHRQPCTTECAPLLSDSLATKSKSSQASSLKQKHEITTAANSARVDADAVFIQQLFCCPITKVCLPCSLTMSCWHVVNDSKSCDYKSHVLASQLVMYALPGCWQSCPCKSLCAVCKITCTQPGCLSICVLCDS